MPISAFIFGGRRSNDRAAGVPGLQLEPRRLPRAPPWARRATAAADRHGRRGAPRPDGDAALLRLQHGRLLRPLAERRPPRPEPAAHLPRQLVPQGRRRQVPLARLRREHARAASGSSTACTAAAAASKARSAGCRATRTSSGRASTSRPTVPRADDRRPRRRRTPRRARTRSSSTSSSTGCRRSSSTSASCCAPGCGARRATGTWSHRTWSGRRANPGGSGHIPSPSSRKPLCGYRDRNKRRHPRRSRIRRECRSGMTNRRQAFGRGYF